MVKLTKISNQQKLQMVYFHNAHKKIVDSNIIITQNIQKMQRGRSQHSRTLEAKLKNVIEKSKPSQSKGKNFIDPHHLITTQSYSKNISANTSPSLVKQSDNDKQNLEVLETVIKIVSAAADARQKQILLSLASHIQKQKKIRSYLTQKQSNSEKTQLQAMLTHLKQQELKDISALKIQIGKRKLHNLDQHDLGEDILNLNSYVMRRSKKQSSILKAQGTDLVGEIYNKFDEQTKIISQMLGEKAPSRGNNHKEKQINEEIGLNQSILNCKTIQSYGKDEKQRVSTGKISDISQNSSSSELMHKILRLEKQNLRLMKEIGKIEEEFECVVEEKLLLEQKLERVKASYRHSKKRLSKCLNQLKCQFNQQKDLHQNSKKGIIELLRSQKRYFAQQFSFIQTKVSQITAAAQQKINSPVSTPDHQNQNPSQEERQIQDNPTSSFESQNSVLERYEALLTQKQLQINAVLKSISKIKQEKQIMAQQLNLQKQKLQEQKIKKNRILEILRNLSMEVSNIKGVINQPRKIFIGQIEKLKKLVVSIEEDFILRMYKTSQQFNYLSSKSQKLESQLLSKHTEIHESTQKIKLLQSESKKWQAKYEEQVSHNENQRKRLAQQINKIENILKFEQQKAKQSLDEIRNSFTSVTQEKSKKIDDQEVYIQEIRKQKLLYEQHSNEKKKQIQLLREQIQNLKDQISQQRTQKDKLINLQKISEQKQQQLIKNIQELKITGERDSDLYILRSKHEQILKLMEQQFMARQSSTIEECGMLLQGKSQQIGDIILLVQRQKIIKQDLLSFLTRNQQKIQRQKIKLNVILNKVQSQLTQLRTQRQKINQFIQKIKEQVRSMQNLLYKQFQSKTVDLFKTKINQRLCFENEVMQFKSVPSKDSIVDQKEIDQILKIFPNQEQNNENLTKNDKLERLKSIVRNLVQELNTKKKQLSLIENEKCQNFQIIRKQSQKQELNEYEALSPAVQIEQKKSENSSFLCELQPFKFENLLGEQSVSLSDIINESVIVQQVQALRNELAESLKRNQYYKRELKIYQQKDIDKIFDF